MFDQLETVETAWIECQNEAIAFLEEKVTEFKSKDVKIEGVLLKIRKLATARLMSEDLGVPEEKVLSEILHVIKEIK